jgi:biofilm PGA synthesis N-glycosyltransferase PgaC
LSGVLISLCVLSFLLIFQFLGYPLVTLIAAVISKPKKKHYGIKPFVSIIVPAYNEEKVIGKRIDNLQMLDYPKDRYEVIVVESGSTDNTYQIVQDIIDKNEEPRLSLKLVREEHRKGKASAINLGRELALGDIILVTDANALFEESVLKEIAPHFENPRIGGVGGRYLVANVENGLASSAAVYWELEYIMRTGESALGSACLFHGEINSWRKGLIDADTNMLSEDLDMAIRITRQGYKLEYEPKAMVYEPAAITSKEQIIQRKRTSIGTIQCIFKHWSYFLFPRNSYSLFIFPSHKILPMLSPFILLAILGLYIAAFDIRIIATHFLLTTLIFMLLLGMLMFCRSVLIKHEGGGFKFSIAMLPRLVYYVLLNEYLILLAWKDFLFGRYSVLWMKASSTR